MSNIFKAIKGSIVKSIDYATTIRTGEITADNGDGTYDVRIAQSDRSYPNVETINYGAIFLVGEIVDMIFEYGCKESPKIIGHSKRIAQDPTEVEVDYSDNDIDIGSAAIDRDQACASATYIDINNPANRDGRITSVEIWFRDTIQNVKVAIFYKVSGDYYSTRSSVNIAEVLEGSKQTFAADLTVKEGDFIGIYFPTGGSIEFSYGGNLMMETGDHIPCTNKLFYLSASTISLYGTGIKN